MRPITYREARQCEQGGSKWCLCRCKGDKHGARRAVTREEFQALPASDPHKVSLYTAAQARNLRRRVAAYAIAQVTMWGNDMKQVHYMLRSIETYRRETL
jgi:hypothetical protein